MNAGEESRAAVHAAALLGVPVEDAGRLQPLRQGLRSRALFVTPEGLEHRFRARSHRVVVKLYKGDGRSEGSLGYQRFHGHDFARVPELAGHPRIQKSLEGGRDPVAGPYAVLGYIAGEELGVHLEAGVPQRFLRRALHAVLVDLWIPLWDAGLRFKDCHPGNFIVGTDGELHLIDAEQMRKSVAEHLGGCGWSVRYRHEAQALRRLPGLLERLVAAAPQGRGVKGLRRQLKAQLVALSLPERLAELGRGGAGPEAALRATDQLIERLTGGEDHDLR
ncbi:MAG: hypothetical protein V2J02_12470 [Pseudomonadales bacterium]|jgi:hypothetical protein|nr:hypothetical protein [Pseudomonadales bacterium]